MVLHQLSEDAEKARRLSDELAPGERVVSVDPNVIEPSIVRDRMEGWADRQGFEALTESLRVHGQQVPVLLRPTPGATGRYQVAYGHRRVEALRRLASPVSAIIRDLSDHDLILAQAKENLEREELSFIELACFADRLEERGFERALVQDALGLERTTLAKMLSLVRALPAPLVSSIGPAPKIGRPRWEELQDLLVKTGDLWRSELEKLPPHLGSNERFLFMLRALSNRPKASGPDLIKAPDGRVLAKVARTKGDLKLTISAKSDPAFGDYLASRLPDLYSEFLARN
jgi:ParB family chromosome partitioning protein